jgi:hypothetical protein
MKRLIVHAGLPKTGSSALQVFLARNHAALRRQSFDYFQLGEFNQGSAGKISSGNGLLVACSLLPEGAWGATKDPAHLAALNQAIAASPCETGILSSEHFTHCDPAQLKDWAGRISATGCRVTFVYYIRDQVQMLSSMYVQSVKRSHCRETPEAFVRHVYRDLPYLKYASFHQARCEMFGAGNVICETYESALRAPGGFCASFLAAIGADATGIPCETETINAGLSPAELAIMRELNKFSPHTRLSDQLVDNRRLTSQASMGETYNMLPPALVQEIEAYFAAENTELAQRLFGRDVLFPTPSLAEAIGNIDEFSKTDLINVLGGLLVRYDERLAALESRLHAQNPRPLKRLIRKLTPKKLAASLASFF